MKKLQLFAVLALLFSTLSAHATILWAGGEDIDFPNNVAGGPANTWNVSGRYDPTYSRAAVFANTGYVVSTGFAGGAVTSAWLHAVVYSYDSYGGTSALTPIIGLTGGPSSIAGLWLATTGFGTKLTLYKFDGTTFTALASEVGGSLPCCQRYALDVQLVNYGASSSVNVYINGSPTPIISYTGNVTVAGVSSVGAVGLCRVLLLSFYPASQIIVSDTDTRSMHLASLVPNAAGDANAWTGSYTNINPILINDTSLIYDTNAGDNFETKMNGLPAGTFWVPAVIVKARGVRGFTGLGSLGVGVKTNSTVSVPGLTALQPYWNTTESYYQTNPVTTSSWTNQDVNALQINLQSGN